MASLLLVVAGGAAVAPARLQLKCRVQVRTATITLADLLPGDAPASVKAISSAIVVGGAPQPGVGRVFSRPELQAILSSSPLTPPGLVVPANVLVERVSSQVSRGALVRAIRQALRGRAGFDASGLRPDQVVLPFPIYAEPGEPLRVESFERVGGSDQLRFTIRLVDQPGRAPFSVLAPVQVDVPVLVATRSLKPGDVLHPGDVRAVGRGPVPAYAGFRLVCPVAAGQTVRPAMLRPALLVFAGHPVAMVYQGDGYTLSTTVVPVRSASMGEIVQVRSLASHAVVSARVVGAGEVVPLNGAFHALQVFRH